jgi:hypothetical protein
MMDSVVDFINPGSLDTYTVFKKGTSRLLVPQSKLTVYLQYSRR